jgi:hypothetical protein
MASNKQLGLLQRASVFRRHAVIYGFMILCFFIWWIGSTRHPAILILPTLWGCLLVAHWFIYAEAKADEQAVEHLDYGGETPVVDGALNLPLIRRTVEAELGREKARRRSRFFRLNVAVYVVFMLLAWIVIPALFGPFFTESAFYSLVLFSGMGLGELILHYRALRLDTQAGETDLHERLLGRAVQHLMADDIGAEKPKRHVRLSEDRELVETADPDDDPMGEKRYDLL